MTEAGWSGQCVIIDIAKASIYAYLGAVIAGGSMAVRAAAEVPLQLTRAGGTGYGKAFRD